MFKQFMYYGSEIKGHILGNNLEIPYLENFNIQSDSTAKIPSFYFST